MSMGPTPAEETISQQIKHSKSVVQHPPRPRTGFIGYKKEKKDKTTYQLIIVEGKRNRGVEDETFGGNLDMSSTETDLQS